MTTWAKIDEGRWTTIMEGERVHSRYLREDSRPVKVKVIKSTSCPWLITGELVSDLKEHLDKLAP